MRLYSTDSISLELLTQSGKQYLPFLCFSNSKAKCQLHTLQIALFISFTSLRDNAGSERA